MPVGFLSSLFSHSVSLKLFSFGRAKYEHLSWIFFSVLEFREIESRFFTLVL